MGNCFVVLDLVQYNKNAEANNSEPIDELDDFIAANMESLPHDALNSLQNTECCPTNEGVCNWTEPFDAPISEKSYMVGCAMGGGRILRQMEIMVSGQVVLCCDDADGKTNYGNVFEIGIEQA